MRDGSGRGRLDSCGVIVVNHTFKYLCILLIAKLLTSGQICLALFLGSIVDRLTPTAR